MSKNYVVVTVANLIAPPLCLPSVKRRDAMAR